MPFSKKAERIWCGIIGKTNFMNGLIFVQRNRVLGGVAEVVRLKPLYIWIIIHVGLVLVLVRQFLPILCVVATTETDGSCMSSFGKWNCWNKTYCWFG
jgi:hypothetical protein